MIAQVASDTAILETKKKQMQMRSGKETERGPRARFRREGGSTRWVPDRDMINRSDSWTCAQEGDGSPLNPPGGRWACELHGRRDSHICRRFRRAIGASVNENRRSP